MKLRNLVMFAGLSLLTALPVSAWAAPSQGGSSPAHADGGKHDGDDYGNSGGGGNSGGAASSKAGGPSNANGHREGGGKGKDGGNGDGHEREKEKETGGATSDPDPGLPPTNTDAEQIRMQVEADTAIPLDQVLKFVAMVSSGRMLEIKPFKVGGVLIYDVTVLEQNGVVRHILLDARTGRQVRIQR